MVNAVYFKGDKRKMTEEQIKQKADDYIITRQNHIKYFSGEAVKILLKILPKKL